MRKILIGILIILGIIVVGCSMNNGAKTSDISTEELVKVNTNYNENTKLENIDLDKESWEKLNIFFSNFSEADVPFFEKDKLVEEELILFGIRHNILNNPKRIDDDNKISSKYVEESVKKYFGKEILNHKTVKAYEIGDDIGYFEYNSGYYSFRRDASYQIDPYTCPTGETFMFSQVRKIQYDIENKVYNVSVDIYDYYPDMDFNGDIYSEEPKEWILKTKPENRDNIPTVRYKVTATIEKLMDGRYILIDYTQIK